MAAIIDDEMILSVFYKEEMCIKEIMTASKCGRSAVKRSLVRLELSGKVSSFRSFHDVRKVMYCRGKDFIFNGLPPEEHT